MKKLDEDNFDSHKEKRLEHKSAFLYLYSRKEEDTNMRIAEATRYTNPIKKKYRQKRLAAESTCSLSPPS